jgi:hypothetical protein
LTSVPWGHAPHRAIGQQSEEQSPRVLDPGTPATHAFLFTNKLSLTSSPAVITAICPSRLETCFARYQAGDIRYTVLPSF